MKAAVIGGDLRQFYLAQKLRYEGFTVTEYGMMKENTKEMSEEPQLLKKVITEADIIILPIPVSVDGKTVKVQKEDTTILLDELIHLLTHGQVVFGGVFGQELSNQLSNRKILVKDFMQMDEIAIKNAVATAEGAIVEAIKMSPENLHDQKCLVIGYGRCGKVICDKLKGMSTKVTVMARRKEVREEAKTRGLEAIGMISGKELFQFRYIFNTAPHLVLDAEKLSYVNPECIIIDLASKPGGTDFSYCQKNGIKAKLCGSLPGIYAPKTSGEILADAVLNVCAQ